MGFFWTKVGLDFDFVKVYNEYNSARIIDKEMKYLLFLCLKIERRIFMNNTKYSFLPQDDTGRLSVDDTRKYFSRFFLSVFTFELVSFVLTYGIIFIAAAVIHATAPSLVDNADFVSLLESGVQFISLYGISIPAFFAVSSSSTTTCVVP